MIVYVEFAIWEIFKESFVKVWTKGNFAKYFFKVETLLISTTKEQKNVMSRRHVRKVRIHFLNP